MRTPLLLALTLLPLVGCQTRQLKSPVAVPAVARVARPASLWEVHEPGQEALQGYVVFFSSEDQAQDSLYVVRNRWHQDLGLVDGLGRAYRYRPHQEEAEWVGSGTLLEGVRRILDVGEASVLRESSIPKRGGRPAGLSAPSSQVPGSKRATEAAQEGTS